MGDDIDGEVLDCFRGDEFAAIEEGHGLGNFHEGEGGAGAGRELDFRDVSGGGYEGDRVVAKFLAKAYFLRGGGDVDDVLAVEDALHFGERMASFLIGENAGFFFCGDVAEAALHGEAIHLGFGKGVCAAKLDGVLGSDDEEEVIEIVANALDGDLALAHGFEECALGAWGGAIYFIGEEYIGEDGALVEKELLGFRI